MGEDSRKVASAPGSSALSDGDSGSQVEPSPSLSVQLPSPPSFSVRLPPVGRPFDKNCVGLDEPRRAPQHYGTLTYDKLRRLRGSRGYAKKSSKAALRTRWSTMDTLERKRSRNTQADESEGAGGRTRVEEPHLAFLMDEGAAEARRMWGLLSKDVWVASSLPPLASMDAAFS